MDGNGRWANRRGMPRTFGHKIGYDKVKTVLKRCSELKIPVCSIYAFSTENWNRPKDEIDEIFRIVRERVDADTPLFNEWNVRVSTMGDITKFPKDLQDALGRCIESTKSNTGTVLNLCVNYGGRADIVRAAGAIKGGSKSGAPTEAEFAKYLYGADLPDPDLIVRTGGDIRISNFLLWQCAYSEFLFIKPFWPDMSAKWVDKCVREFGKRNRRFGSVK